MLVLLVGTAMPACSDATVTFPDLSLDTAIRDTINKPEGPILISDLKSLTMLKIQEIGISDLTGLEHCINLQYLELWYNNISDLSPLAGLTNLDYLFLTSNNISDLSPLAGLTNLDYLFLTSNNISDLSPLAGNIGLLEGDNVDLRDNPLSTMSLNIYVPQLEQRGVNVIH